jgi:hypothetical protein
MGAKKLASLDQLVSLRFDQSAWLRGLVAILAFVAGELRG